MLETGTINVIEVFRSVFAEKWLEGWALQFNGKITLHGEFDATELRKLALFLDKINYLQYGDSQI